MRLALESLYFTIDGKFFQVTSTDKCPIHFAIDYIINLQTRERFVVKRIYIIGKPIKWLQLADVAHLNPIQ
jgi:hypothetical protein